MSFTVHVGDCRSVLAQMPERSVDTVICDPPYGLAFMGKGWDQQVPGADYWRAALRVAKPGAMLLAFGGTRTWHHLAVAIEQAGWEIRDSLMWLYGSGFPKSLDIAKAIDKAAGAEREVVGVSSITGARSGSSFDDGCKGNRRSFQNEEPVVNYRTAPATDAAKRWTGWGTALKPAWEPIILAMRPLDGTFAENAQRHGVAGLAIDAGRIESPDADAAAVQRQSVGASFGAKAGHVQPTYNPGGRWPANVLLDQQAGDLLDQQAGDLSSGSREAGVRTGLGYHGADGDGGPAIVGSSGGASRFFYVAKAARSERGVGNDHPTVKPIDLMRYLCRLTRTPSGGTVLDPFCGSGSTGVGAMLDGRDFIGIELDPHSAEIARRRIAEADPIGRQGDLLDVLADGGA
jgi:hypothetical protein